MYKAKIIQEATETEEAIYGFYQQQEVVDPITGDVFMIFEKQCENTLSEVQGRLDDTNAKLEAINELASKQFTK